MRAPLAVFVSMLFVTVVVARADDSFKWNAFDRREARAGTKFAEELSKSDRRSLKFMLDGERKVEVHEGTEKIRLIHAVASVSSKGITEDKITVERWMRAWDKDSDDSLEGSTLTVKGEGAFRTWAAEGEKPVTRAANTWVQQHIVKDGKRDPALDELDWDFILPREPLADGSTWTIDPATFAREVMGPQVAIDAKKSQGSGKLTAVKLDNGVHFGHVEVSVSLALETLGSSKVTWKKGGVQEFRYVLDLSLEPRRRDVVAGLITMELLGEGSVEPPGRDPLDLEIEEKSRLEVRRMPVE